MLSGAIGALLHATLVAEAALTLEKKLHAFAAAELTLRVEIPCHLSVLPPAVPLWKRHRE
jgi:hypothetical protein